MHILLVICQTSLDFIQWLMIYFSYQTNKTDFNKQGYFFQSKNLRKTADFELYVVNDSAMTMPNFSS